MEDKLKNLEEIESWLKGEMNGDEKTVFEKKLESDPKLKEEVEDVEALQLGIIHANQKSIRAQLNGVKAELKSENFFDEIKSEPAKVVSLEQRKSKNSIRSILAIAASVLLVIGIGSYLFMSNNSITENNYNAQIAFENHYKPDTKEVANFLDRLEARGVSDPVKASKMELAAALSLYNEGKYKEALPQLKAFLEKNPKDNIANLYTGLTLLELPNHNDALKYLQIPSNDTSFQKSDMAKWYAALCHVKTDTNESKTKAKKLLKELLNTTYKQQATELLKTIK